MSVQFRVRPWLTSLAAATMLATAVSTATFGAVDPEASKRFYQEAVEEVQRGDLAAAVIQLRNAIQRDPDNLEARILLGRVQLTLNDAVSAEKELRRVWEANPTDDVEVMLGEALLAQNKFDEVISTVTEDALTPEARLNKLRVLAAAYTVKQDLDKASSLYATMISIDPNSLEGRYGIARMNVLRRDFDAAKSEIEAILSDDENFGPAWLLRGELALETGDLATAETALGKAITLQPNELTAYISRARLRLVQGKVDLAREDARQAQALARNNPIGYYMGAAVDFAAGDISAANEQYNRIADRLEGFAPANLLGALIKYRNGEYAQSELLLSRYLAQFPDNKVARRALGLVRIRIDSPRGAIDILEDLVEEDPNDIASTQALASAYLRLGDYQKASELYERLQATGRPGIAQQAKAAQTLLCKDVGLGAEATEACNDLLPDELGKGILLVLDYVNTGDLETAQSTAEKLAAEQPQNPLVLNTLGSVLIARRDYGRARENLEAALLVNPNFISAIDNLNRLDQIEGKPELTVPRLERLIARSADKAELVVQLAKIHADRSQPDQARAAIATLDDIPMTIRIRQKLMETYLQMGDQDSAMKTVDDLVAARSDDIAVQRFAVGAYGQMKNLDKAITSAEKAISLTEPNTQLYLGLARMQWLKGDKPGAEASVRKAHELDKAAVPPIASLVDIRLDAGDVDGAIAAARMLGEENPGEARRFEARVLSRTGKPAEALEMLQKLMADMPTTPVVVDLYALSAQMGKAPEGFNVLEDWVKAHPNDRTATTIYASAVLRKGDFGAAEAIYRDLLVKDPTNAVLLNNMAWVRFKLNRPDSAQYAERAYQIAPNSAAIADTYGWILVQEGKLDSGLAILRTAAAGAPELAEIQYHYAYALHQSGDKEAAREVLKKVIEAGQTFDGIAEAKALYEKLANG